MNFIETLDELQGHYGPVPDGAIRKVARELVPVYHDWIAASRFCVVASVGPDGTDASPRGDDGPVVQVLDARTLALPDWPGNNRIDSLRNVVVDGRVSLMFLVTGSDNVVRVNGEARMTADEALRRRFTRNDRLPRTVMVVRLAEVYVQCSRALIRAGLWPAVASGPEVPTQGQIQAAMKEDGSDSADYDRRWAAEARAALW